MPFPIQHYDDEGRVDIDVLGESVSEEQFRTVHEPRGWRRVDEATVAAAEITGEVKPLEDRTVSELLEIAGRLGVPGVKGSMRKAEIITAIEGHVAPEEDE